MCIEALEPLRVGGDETGPNRSSFCGKTLGFATPRAVLY
jgi:hypothetical protein